MDGVRVGYLLATYRYTDRVQAGGRQTGSSNKNKPIHRPLSVALLISQAVTQCNTSGIILKFLLLINNKFVAE
jgi:hypothetical protein